MKDYKWRDLGDGKPIKVRNCPKCAVAPSGVDDCGEFGNPECPYFGIGLEEFEKREELKIKNKLKVGNRVEIVRNHLTKGKIATIEVLSSPKIEVSFCPQWIGYYHPIELKKIHQASY